VPVVKHFFALCLFKQDVTATSSSAAAPSSPRLGRNFFKDGLLNSPCAADAVTGINIVAASATTKAVSLALVEEEEDVTVAVDVGRARFLAPTGLGAAWGEGVHSSSELKSLYVNDVLHACLLSSQSSGHATGVGDPRCWGKEGEEDNEEERNSGGSFGNGLKAAAAGVGGAATGILGVPAEAGAKAKSK
jgi:hypothetical protein